MASGILLSAILKLPREMVEAAVPASPSSVDDAPLLEAAEAVATTFLDFTPKGGDEYINEQIGSQGLQNLTAGYADIRNPRG